MNHWYNALEKCASVQASYKCAEFWTPFVDGRETSAPEWRIFRAYVSPLLFVNISVRIVGLRELSSEKRLNLSSTTNGQTTLSRLTLGRSRYF